MKLFPALALTLAVTAGAAAQDNDDWPRNVPISPICLARQSRQILCLTMHAPKDGKVVCTVTRVIKGPKPDKPVVIDLTEELFPAFPFREAFKADAFAGDRFKEMPAMLFVGNFPIGLPEFPAKGHTLPPDTELAAGALIRVGCGWYSLSDDPPGTWMINEQARLASGVWLGSIAQLERGMEYIVTAGDKAWWPLQDDLYQRWKHAVYGPCWKPGLKIGAAPGEVRGLTAVDLSDDGRPGIFALSDAGDRLFTWEADSGKFVDATAARHITSRSLMATFGDFDGDGRLDLCSWDGTHLSVWTRAADGTFDATPARAELKTRCLCLDAFGPGNAQPARIVVSTPEAPLVAMLNDKREIEIIPVAPAAASEEVTGDSAAHTDWGKVRPCLVADFDGDGYNDLVQPFARGGLFYRGGKDGSFERPRPCGDEKSPERALATLKEAATGPGLSLLTSPEAARRLLSGEGEAVVRTTDFDGDGRLDITFFTDMGWVQWRNIGEGAFVGPASMGWVKILPVGYRTVGVPGDVNNDGLQDVAALQAGAPPVLVLNQGFSHLLYGGQIETEMEAGATDYGDNQKELLVDVDGNGDLDLVLALTGGGLWCVMQETEPAQRLSVRAALPVAAKYAGPLRVTAWVDGRCLGAQNVTAGTQEAFFGMRKAGEMTLKWQWPGKQPRETTVKITDKPVRVLLGPDGRAAAPADRRD